MLNCPEESILSKIKRSQAFSWFEESLAGRKKEVPFDLEAALEKKGADYEKALIPDDLESSGGL